MGLSTIVHWIIVFAAVSVVPLVATYRENSPTRVGRASFALWLVVPLIAAGLIGKLLETIFHMVNFTSNNSAMISSAILGVSFFVFMYFLQQAVVRRARDGGHGKGIAYVAIVPFVSVIIYLYLLVRPHKAVDPVILKS